MSQFWKEHGTKLLGFLVAVVGAMGDCIQLFAAADPNPKHVAVYTLIAGLGAAIVKRGFTNTATLADPTLKPPPTLLWAVIGLLPLVAFVLSACTTLSFDEQLAAAYGTYTTIEKAADQAYVTGVLPKAQAQHVRDLAKDTRPFLDAAQAARTTDPAGASAQLQLGVKALTALQTYVNQQAAAAQGKK